MANGDSGARRSSFTIPLAASPATIMRGIVVLTIQTLVGLKLVFFEGSSFERIALCILVILYTQFIISSSAATVRYRSLLIKLEEMHRGEAAAAAMSTLAEGLPWSGVLGLFASILLTVAACRIVYLLLIF